MGQRTILMGPNQTDHEYIVVQQAENCLSRDKRIKQDNGSVEVREIILIEEDHPFKVAIMIIDDFTVH